MLSRFRVDESLARVDTLLQRAQSSALDARDARARVVQMTRLRRVYMTVRLRLVHVIVRLRRVHVIVRLRLVH